jgi:amino acid adenylation domain-containing protein
METRNEQSTVPGVGASSLNQADIWRHDVSVPHIPLQARQDGAPAPLSFAQERLWFLEQINPGDRSANLSRAVRISGPLNRSALERSVQLVITRHESLRTTFATTELHAEEDGKPMQFVAASKSVELPLIDLSHLARSEREPRARREARAAAQQRFDLCLGPLVRTTLLRLDEHEHIFLLNLHRIVGDEGSREIFFRELWDCYQALANSEPPKLAALPIQYADYATWQREWLQGEVLKEQLDYWRSKLRGSPAVMELPTDRPRPTAQTWHGSLVSLRLENRLTGQLRALSASEGVTLFVTLIAAFQVLLGRYSRQKDIVVGSTVPNRSREGTGNVVGPFSNVLAIRADLSNDPSFSELLEQVKTATLEAKVHQNVPFGKLIEELQLVRSLSHAPLFQVMLKVEELSASCTQVPDLHIENFDFDTGITRLDLTLNIVDKDTQLDCAMEYNTDLFEAATIHRLAGHFERLLEEIAINPQRRIGHLRLLSDTERDQMIVEWNNTRKDYPSVQGIHELFESQVEQTPDRIAVACGDVRLTYRELNLRANQLADRLGELGVRAEERVGICVSRSAEMVVAVLGVLKAGGAYVPLDPAYPQERLAFMVQDSGASVLITEENLIKALPETEARLVCLSSDWEAFGTKAISNPQVYVTGENLAYVIYTSGSTGMPKGVAVEHRSTIAFLRWASEVFRPEQLQGVMASTSLSFDLSVFELLAPLSSGGRVILVENALHLRAAGASENITLVNTVPSAMAELVQTGGFPASVRTVNLAGEPLHSDLLREVYKQTNVDQVHNLYGPSEDTTYSTFCRLEKAGLGEPSIGRPITNTQVYLLDAQLEPVPIGVAGELYLGGAGLARGYLHQPELTAARFIPHPFSDQAGARLYWTGDLARYDAEGNIHFLGRVDHQVKVRGYRIELEEIEAVMAQHQMVRECAVLAREDAPGVKRLVAYFAARHSDGAGEDEKLTSSLRGFLKQRLPDYMVPATFVLLDALPLMPNGKLDRTALPKPDDARPDLHVAYVAPRDKLEEQLAQVWQRVLGVKSVGVRDNFFELGGYSLLAVRLFAQIENRFGRNLPLATLFQSSTVEQLAAVLRETAPQQAWSSLVAIQPNGSRPPLFCVHAAGANVLIYRPLARHLGPDQPVYALQAQGLDGQNKPYVRIEDMAAYYIKEMRVLQPQGPYHLLGASFGGLVIFEMAQQLIAQGKEVALMAMLNTNCPVYSTLQRMRSHVGHFKQQGPKTYARNVIRGIKRRISKTVMPANGDVVADRELLQVLEGRPDADDPLMKTVVAILQAEKDYVPSGIYPGKITLFWANDAKQTFEDNRLGWRRLAAGGLEVHKIPGNHTSIREEPNVAVLVNELKPCLERAQLGHTQS